MGPIGERSVFGVCIVWPGRHDGRNWIRLVFGRTGRIPGCHASHDSIRRIRCLVVVSNRVSRPVILSPSPDAYAEPLAISPRSDLAAGLEFRWQHVGHTVTRNNSDREGM